MAKLDYEIGDTIVYMTFGGTFRKVVVTDKEDDIKNGRPGFGGTLVHRDPEGWNDVWGYDSQITSVTRRS